MDEGRFPPGLVLAQRYRVVSLLGRGGMGEVYRANDLLLGQTVALKFLPDSLVRDEAAVTRFRNEVRMARMVSHKNVCRVHDLGSADGRLFLSMEFVEGEDLGTLLRRIGRLPPDKALEIAHRLCAAIQAAHEKGVIHRDLKPANVMLDAKGDPVITDFGLAGLTGSFRDPGSGTPAYMAPEQREGRHVTARSDIYSLGVMLHELLTGRRPDASGGPEPGIDSAVRQTLERCLDPDPGQRPASAAAVSRALPGGDPLAAALAAGATPSPEVVAAAGERSGLTPGAAAALLALAMTGMIAMGVFNTLRTHVLGASPDELLVRARDFVKQAARLESAPNEIHGVGFEPANFRNRPEADRLWSNHRFWYRTSPVPHGSLRLGVLPRLGPFDPPVHEAGMVVAQFDIRGRLIHFERASDPRSPPETDPGWDLFLAQAGLEPGRLEPRSETQDSKSWGYVDRAGLRYEVDALSERGRPKLFRVTRAGERTVPPSPLPWMIETVLAAVAVAFALRNFRSGRADAKGALTVGVLVLGATVARLLLQTRDIAHWHSLNSPVDAVAPAVLLAVLAAAAYMAMEPFVRRRWPTALVTWTRLLRADWRDATVGRDVLIGLGGAGASLALGTLVAWSAPSPESVVPLTGVQDTRNFLAAILGSPGQMLWRSVLLIFVLFVLRLALRSDWIAGVCCAALLVAMLAGQTGTAIPGVIVFFSIMSAFHVALLLRFGLLACIAAQMPLVLLPLVHSLDPAVWCAPHAYVTLALIAAAGLLALRVATGGLRARPS